MSERTSTRRIGNSRLHDKRGNSKDRAARRLWIMTTFAPLDDPTKVACVHCQILCKADEMEVDRIIPGDTYARHNIQPACRPCNLARSDNADWVYEG